MLSTIRKETESTSQLSSMNLPSHLRKRIVHHAITASNKGHSGNDLMNTIRIDVSKGAKYVVHFINNLERDQIYKRWPKDLNRLLYPSWSLTTLARNLYTCIALVNPLTAPGSNTLLQIQMLHQQQYPIRFGIALWCENDQNIPSDDISSDRNALPSDICRFFIHIKTFSSSNKATEFLIAVASEVQEISHSSRSQGSPYDEYNAMDDAVDLQGHVGVSLYEAAKFAYILTNDNAQPDSNQLITFIRNILVDPITKDDDLSMKSLEIKGKYDSRLYQDFLRNTTEYIEAHNIAMNSFTLNGIYHEVSSNGLGQNLMNLLGREQYLLTHLLQSGLITDKTSSIFNAVLESSKSTYLRYHPLLQEENAVYMDFAKDSIGNKILQRQETFIMRDPSIDQSSIVHTLLMSSPLSSNGLLSAARMLQWFMASDEQYDSIRQQLRVDFIWHVSSQEEKAMECSTSEQEECLSNQGLYDQMIPFLYGIHRQCQENAITIELLMQVIQKYVLVLTKLDDCNLFSIMIETGSLSVPQTGREAILRARAQKSSYNALNLLYCNQAEYPLMNSSIPG